MKDPTPRFSTTPLGLLRAATANFLFNYKMAEQFPKEFSPYLLTQSAQELNAEFNPLVVAFNEDVSAFSTDLMHVMEERLNDGHWYTPWDGHNKAFSPTAPSPFAALAASKVWLTLEPLVPSARRNSKRYRKR